MQWPVAILLLCIASLVYFIALLVYRLHFHTLSKFPGPKIAAATGFYETYFDLFKSPGGQYVYEIERLHRVYGPIVRINPHEIHIRDSSWVRKLYIGVSEGRRNKYPPAAKMLGTPQGTFGTISHDLHLLRRKSISPFFSRKSTQVSEPKIHDMAEKLVQCMNQQISEKGSVDLRICYLAFSTESLFRHCFEQSLHGWNLLGDYKKAIAWHASLGSITSYTNLVKQFPSSIPVALKAPLWVFENFLPSFAPFVKLHKEMQNEAASAVDLFPKEDSNAGVTTNVFMSILSNKSLHASDKEPSRMSQEGFELVAAGAEVVSRILTEATYFILADRDELLPKLREELVGAMPSLSTRASLRELEQLPWLTAIIKETLRISPLLTSRLPLISPQEPLQYKNWLIPKGVPVGMNARDIHTDPQIFDQPNEFKPGRWFPSNPNLEVMNRYYMPFSLGARMCNGQPFAMAELYIGLATVMRHLDLELNNVVKARDIDVIRDCFVGGVSPDTKGVRVMGRS